MPRYGFNFQWMYHWRPGEAPQPPDERALDFLAELGFNFVRVPTDYRFWTRDYAYFAPDESQWRYLDAYLAACQQRGIQLSLNLHRAPGYCINGNELERHNLWCDDIAQDAFVFQWQQLAKRYQDVPAAELSFDLLNEPPEVGQYGLTRANHAALMRRTVAAIRAIDLQREIVIDGLGGGHLAMPELTDLGVIHSGRGYQPQNVTHYQAVWWPDWEGQPEPVYPQTQYLGKNWTRETLRHFYQPWREVQSRGVRVHIGEFGCYNRTPNDVALRWFADLLALFELFGWGYALWQFSGPFGVVAHGRPETRYEQRRGYQVDPVLLELLLAHRSANN